MACSKSLASWLLENPPTIFSSIFNSQALFQDHHFGFVISSNLPHLKTLPFLSSVIISSYPFISHNVIATNQHLQTDLGSTILSSVLVPVSNLQAWIPRSISTITGYISTICSFTTVLISVWFIPKITLITSAATDHM